MYEASFSLQRRPFAATPDPGCWFHDGPFQPVLDELLLCAEQGLGIAILVAPAGAGKTLVCERLVRELSERCAAVFLRHATFSTRRALLQSILCELDRPFDLPTDQELRRGIAKVLKDLHAADRALALVVDEAHQLSEAVLEELRILADQAQEGRPLVRLVLAGQLSLEETLALPSTQALNQRVRAQVALPTLSQAESADYIDYRLTWAGGRTAEIFTPEAIELIGRAADGVPRCLNQLCDQALLSAYAIGERPVSGDTVLEALAHLSRLPLSWNPLPPRQSVPAIAAPSLAADHETAPCDDDLPDVADAVQDVGESAAIEVGDAPVFRLSRQLDDRAPLADRAPVFADATPPQWNEPDVVPTNPIDAPSVDGDAVQEEVVADRYTALDAGLEPPAQIVPSAPPAREPLPVAAILNRWSDLWNQPTAAQRLSERLAAIQNVLDAAAAAAEEPAGVAAPDPPAPQPPQEASWPDPLPAEDGSPEEQLKTAVLELRAETLECLSRQLERPPRTDIGPWPATQSSSADAVLEFGANIVAAPATTSDAAPAELPQRSCRNLFTRLRRKQQGRE